MPYQNTNELPEAVQNSLPEKAQKVYQEAFNNAFEQYKDPSDRRDDTGREETAHRVAWSAVKNAGYEKGEDGNWHHTS